MLSVSRAKGQSLLCPTSFRQSRCTDGNPTTSSDVRVKLPAAPGARGLVLFASSQNHRIAKQDTTSTDYQHLTDDEQVLAAFRAQPKKRKLEHPPSELQRSNNDTSPASSGSPAHSFHPSAKDYDVSSTSGKQDIQLSIPVQELLQEVYFTCMFNSTLIFHRPTFRRGFEEKKLPRYLLLAMYASATTLVSPVLLSTAWWLTIGSFLPSSSTLAKRHASLLRPLGDVQAMGRQWALQAGKEVLQDIDQPCFESVQTCEVLTLYWFSAGDSMRNTMFLGKSSSPWPNIPRAHTI